MRSGAGRPSVHPAPSFARHRAAGGAPIVVVTAPADAARRAAQVSADDDLDKPCTFEELIRVVVGSAG
jgi:CheY-like chemotaxis protein